MARVDEESARKAARAAGKNLMIVESPAKARTLGKFLPKDFVVLASVGHVRDLPKNDLGVDIENDFEPHYVSIRGKADVLKNLKLAASKARAVYLAPDPDREGEAIAWHLAEALQDKKSKSKTPVYRLTFNEITPRAVRVALEQPRDIDQNRVNAQQARRVLDRLVGYKVSPFLWQTVRYGLSAGRVQSVALRLICDREKEIRAFRAQEYWTIEAELETEKSERFRAAVVRVEKRRVGTAQDGERLLETEAQALAEELRAAARAAVQEVKEQERKRNPAPPFITSTLQQEAFKRFRFTSQRTMAIAQQLYEGLDIAGEGSVGLITYMRTDSTRLADDAVAEIRAAIAERYGAEYVPEKPPRYSKREGAQDAHEAVRPTVVSITPESLGKALTAEQAKLYGLVWRRAVASQMTAARDLVTTVDVESGRLGLRASGTVPVFAGFRRVWGVDDDDEAKTSKLPRLAIGDALGIVDVVAERHETQPPPCYTEGTLVKALEELGIGRPSTYATIISTITTRDYVARDRGRLTPTDLGMTVSDLLTERFEDVFEVPFTAQMEEGLDRVESGAEEWHALVRRFYEPFSKDLEKAEAERDRLKRSLEVETDVPCERCGKLLIRRFGRHGPFLACPGYPECKYTRPVEEADAPQEIGEACKLCNAGLVQRTGRFGRFIACSRYPECKYTRPIGLGIACPRPACGGELVERRSRRGKVFFGCNRYPDCDFALWDRPVAQACPQCGAAFLVRKTSKKKGDYLRCVTCNAEPAGEAA
jgi:DNA topoisomerase-1